MFKNLIQKIHAINQKYAKPRLAMSGSVRFCLLFLRFYLLLLVGLLLYKFITVLMA
ncbi:MAG: hypothetical protein HQK55_07070 [Deltaproteobacteria bacterium]|nr:hypothetical protein [Deltaproteobacteria bacterium]